MRYRVSARPKFSTPSFLTLAGIAPAGLLLFASAGCIERKPEQQAASARVSQAAGHEHDHGREGHGTSAAAAKLVISTQPADARSGEPVRLGAMIHRADGSMVSEFEETHEKLIHFVVVREGLDHFAHLHPDVDDAGNLTTEYTFPAGGRYLFYADHKPAGEAQAVARGEVDIRGDAPAAPKLTPNVPGRVSGDGLTAEVSVEAGGAGGETEIAFTLFDESGRPVEDLEPYLGALGHLSILSADGTEFVHSHPLEQADTDGGPVRFAAHFAGTGLYKGWAEFQRSGRVLIVPFVLRVEPPQKT